MGNELKPDKWVIVAYDSDRKTIYKVLAGWSGGYLTGDSWRMNSGITKVEEDGGDYIFHGHSSTVYRCNKKAEGMTAMTAAVLKQAQDQMKGGVEKIGVKDFLRQWGI